jgi:hypothetical protein
MTVIAIKHVQLAMPPGREGEAHAFYAGLSAFLRSPSQHTLLPVAGRGSRPERSRSILVWRKTSDRPARRTQPSSSPGWRSWWPACARQSTRS